MLRLFCVAVLIFLVNGYCYAGALTPIKLPNSLPVMEGAGLSVSRDSELLGDGRIEFSLRGVVQSHANAAGSKNESLIVDAEVHRIDFTSQWAFASRWQLNVEVSLLEIGAGNLDGLINQWHNAFSLPDGDRDDLPEDEFLVRYVHDEEEQNLFIGQRGVSDTSLNLAYQLIDTTDSKLASYIGVSLPTGNPNKLTGSNRVDWQVALAYSRRLADRWSVHANASAVLPGDDSLFGVELSTVIMQASLGAHWSASDRWRWTAQLDGRSQVFKNTNVPELIKNAWLLSLGLEYRNGWQVYLAEDITVNRAADFSIGVGWHKEF